MLKKIISICITIFFNTDAYSINICINNNCNQLILKSYKDIRDTNIIKQNLDFSCGSASIATVLNYFYKYKITELQILKDMNKADGMANFEDMQKVVNKYGFKALGLSMNIEALRNIKIPVIVYIKYRNQEHFSVLQGISNSHIQLADPSLGKYIIHISEFEKMWNVNKNIDFKGRVLAIIPNDKNIATIEFMINPEIKQSLYNYANEPVQNF